MDFISAITPQQCLYLLIKECLNPVSSAFSSSQQENIYNPCQKSWDTCAFLLLQFWSGYYSRLSAPEYVWLNIGEGEGHIWVRTKVRRVNKKF